MSDNNPKGSVFATVEVTVRVTFSSPWSLGEKMENIIAQAQRDAPAKVEQILRKDRQHEVQVIGIRPNVWMRFEPSDR